MTGYTRKSPENQQKPYKSMLGDFEAELKNFRSGGRWLPLYIIISSEDKDQLLSEMTVQKIIMDKKPSGKLQYLGIKIIETPDFSAGFFDIVG